MSNESHTPECRSCGDEYSVNRWKLGYKFCLPCGEQLAKTTRHTIVPMAKSNYVVVTDRELLKGLNKYANT